MKKFLITIAVIIILCFVCLQTCVYQKADMSIDMTVKNPKYSSTNSPIILFDAGHGNFHGINTTFEPFAKLMENDGVTIKEHNGAITNEALENADLFVIANATAPDDSGNGTGSAFTDSEIIILTNWVENGGSLLLIADHDPFGSAAAKLANSVGVGMESAWTVDTLLMNKEIGNPTWLEYTYENGGLTGHEILHKGNTEMEVSRVITFTGQSLSFDSTWTSILQLSSVAQNYYDRADADMLSEDTNTFFRVPGESQMVAHEYGDGKIIIAGEAAMFTAQKARIFLTTKRVGFNYPGYNNKQFVLNIMHWLLSEKN